MGRRAKAPEVGARIRERRTELGLTQAQLGEPRFTSGYVSLIECGHRLPSESTLNFIADRLNVTPDELLSGIPAGLEARLELQLHVARRDLDAGHAQRAGRLVERVLEEARDHQLKRVEARAEETLAAIDERTAGPEAALAHYRRAEDLWRGEPIHLRSNAVMGIAHCTRMLGNPQMAVHFLDCYRRDLITNRQPHPDALMRTYTEMVYAYFAVGLPEKASEAAREALRLESQVDDPDEVACMHLTVARSLMYERQFEDALNSIRRAHELYLAGGWKNMAAKAKIAEGIVLSKKDDYEGARNRLVAALALLEESPNRLDEVLALNELGRVTRHLDDPPGAISFLERARPLLENGDVLERAFNAREMGLCLQRLDPAAAETHLREALDLYRLSGATDDLAVTCRALGDIYVASNHLDLALATLREGLDYVAQRAF